MSFVSSWKQSNPLKYIFELVYISGKNFFFYKFLTPLSQKKQIVSVSYWKLSSFWLLVCEKQVKRNLLSF